MSSSGIGRRTLIGGFWSQIGLISNTLLLFAFSVLVTRTLTPQERGDLDVYITIMSIAVLIAQAGMGGALVRFAPETHSPNDAPRRRALFLFFLRSRLLICTGIGLGIALFRDPIAGLLRADLFRQTWWIFIGALFGNQILDLVTAGLQSSFRLRASVLLQVGRVALNIAFYSLTVLLFGSSAFWVVVVTAVSALLVSLSGTLYLLHTNPPANNPPALPSTRTLHRYAFGAWLLSLTTIGLSNQSDILLINLILRDKAQVAYYNTAYQLVMQALAVLTGWTQVVLPAIVATLESRGSEGIKRAWETLTKAQVFILFPGLLLVARLAPHIIETLYGSVYLPSAPLLSLLGISLALVHLFGNIAHHALFVAGQMRFLVIIRLISAALSATLNLALLPLLGLTGTVIATSASLAVTLWVEFAFAQRTFKLKYPARFAFQIILASFAANLSSLWIDTWATSNFLAMVAIVLQTSVFTLLVLWLTKPFSTEDAEMLRALLPRYSPLLYPFVRS